MKTPVRTLFSTGSFLALAAWLLQPQPCQPAQEPGDHDDKMCERQLNIITGALREYRKKHGDRLPEKLSDLTPEYIHDENMLACPIVLKRGGLRTWKKRFRELSPDPYTSYGYEFPPVPVEDNQWRGFPKKTWREVKQREVVLFGQVVPIVRCHDHKTTLNLALDGRIYESEMYWQKNFTQNVDTLTIGKLFSTPAPDRPDVSHFPPRDPGADLRQLDLTSYYNARLTDSWQGFPGNNLGGLKTGLREFGSVRFDVRGVIQLQGTDIPAEYPPQVTGIKVHQKCRRIHFLHATSFTYRRAIKGFYFLHYADGEIREFPLVYGAQIADWWRDPQKPVEPTDATVAWTGENEAARAYGKTVCLHHAIWENPRPETEIATMSFDAGTMEFLAGIFVVAITLE